MQHIPDLELKQKLRKPHQISFIARCVAKNCKSNVFGFNLPYEDPPFFFLKYLLCTDINKLQQFHYI